MNIPDHRIQSVQSQSSEGFTVVVQVEGAQANTESQTPAWKIDLLQQIGAAAGTIMALHGIQVGITVPETTESYIKVGEKESVHRRIAEAYTDHDLTPQEQRVTELLLRGLTATEIGRQLCLTPGTVRNYSSLVLQKTGARTQSGIAYALLGLL